jgi:hypothetical protein
VAGLILDLLEQRLLGLTRAQAGHALQRALVLVAQMGELLLLRGETLDVRLQVALARVELGRPAVERALQRLRALGGAHVGRSGGCRRFAPPGVDRRGVGMPAVGRGEPSAPVQRGGRDEAECQDGRRDDEFHCRVLSPRAGMAPSPDGLPWFMKRTTGRARGGKRRRGRAADRPRFRCAGCVRWWWCRRAGSPGCGCHGVCVEAEAAKDRNRRICWSLSPSRAVVRWVDRSTAGRSAQSGGARPRRTVSDGQAASRAKARTASYARSSS